MLPRYLIRGTVKAIEQLSAETLREYRDIFSFFDRDGGGSIGAEEFEVDWRPLIGPDLSRFCFLIGGSAKVSALTTHLKARKKVPILCPGDIFLPWAVSLWHKIVGVSDL